MAALYYMLTVYVLSILGSKVVCDTKHILSSSDCKQIKISSSSTTIKWSSVGLTDCKIELTKENYKDNQICVKMTSIDLKNTNNEVTFYDQAFQNTYGTYLKSWKWYSSSSSLATCTYSSTHYIMINTVFTLGASFELKVYSNEDDIPELVKSAVVTVGVIVGCVIGAIFLIIIVLVVVVCCCCMKSRRSPGTVYRQPATTSTVVTSQQQMVPHVQSQAAYPSPQPVTGYPTQYPVTTGYPAQPMTGYHAPPPQGSSVPPSENQESTEKPPPYYA